MERQPPDFVLRLRRTIENGTEEEAVKAQEALNNILRKAGQKGQAARKAKLAEKKDYAQLEQERELDDFTKQLLAGNAHLMPRGEFPKDIDDLLEQYRPDSV